MIQDILPNSEPKIRILRHIYRNSGINFSELVKNSKTSPNIVLKYVNELVKNGIIKEKRIGGKRKTHIRLFYPDFSGLGADIFSFIEIEEKNKFLKKYKELKPLVSQIEELLSSVRIRFCLVYGSFARFSADEESDLDIWIVGKMDSKTKNRMREIFSTLEREYNITVEDERRFLKRISDPIHQNILSEHIIIYGEKEFLKILNAFK